MKIASPSRSIQLRSRTVRSYKSPRLASMQLTKAITKSKTSAKSSPKHASTKITFTPLKAPSSSKPASPTRMINSETGTMLIVKKPSSYSYFKHLLRSMNKVQMRTGCFARSLTSPEPLAC